MSEAPATPAGWFPDPEHAGRLRYWDGAAWTEHRSPAPPADAATPVPTVRPPAPQATFVGPATFRIVGTLLVVAGALQIVSYAGEFAVAVGASILQSLALIGVFALFVRAGFPHRGVVPRVLSIIAMAIYAVALLLVFANGNTTAIATQGLLGFGILGLGIAFGVVTLRTRGVPPRIALLPVSLYLLLLLLSAGATRLRADGAVYLPAGAYLLVGILFIAFARPGSGTAPAVDTETAG